jgi:uncharacterized phage protein (TIGR01671 family)
MREIKFRGKRLDNGKWESGDLLENQGRNFIYHATSESTIEDNDDGRIVVVAVEVDSSTVSQYTGLKDKNTRKVYEGDVLTDKFESVGVVEWQNGCFVVNFGDVDVFQISDCFDDSYQMWVIGNIHDNPELLKGGEQ